MLLPVHAVLALFNSSLTLVTQTLPCCAIDSRCTVRTSPQPLPGFTVEVSEKAQCHAYTVYPSCPQLCSVNSPSGLCDGHGPV